MQLKIIKTCLPHVDVDAKRILYGCEKYTLITGKKNPGA